MKCWPLMLLLASPAAAQDTSPFPPGENAALVKQICSGCHDGRLVVSKQYDDQSARRYWRVMMGTDPESDDARKVIAYLTTVLGVSDDGGPDAIR